MKTILVAMLMFSTVLANAAQEVVFDPKDSRPSDQPRRQNAGVFAKVLNHNGQAFTVMYEASEDRNRTLSTRVIAVCTVIGANSIRDCMNERRVSNPNEILSLLTAQRRSHQCSEIALIHSDNMKSRQAITNFQTQSASRDNATNQREMAIIMNGINNQVEALSTKLNQNIYTANVATARHLLNTIANRQISEQDAMKHLAININILNNNYADLLSKAQCTNEELQVCAINKQNGQIVTPGTTIEETQVFDELTRRGIIEVKACSLAPQQQQVLAPTPVIDNTPVATPQIQPIEQESITPVLQ